MNLKDAPGGANVAILDGDKKVVATLPVAKQAGMQSVVWNLTHGEGKEQVPPGDYTVRLQVGERMLTRPLRVEALQQPATEEE